MEIENAKNENLKSYVTNPNNINLSENWFGMTIFKLVHSFYILCRLSVFSQLGFYNFFKRKDVLGHEKNVHFSFMKSESNVSLLSSWEVC